MLTIFTPTYNRAFSLPRLYNSLLRQTSKDFEWLVIDDGSSDSTESLFDGWLSDAKIRIRYYKIENGGKQRAINKALDLAKGEYFFIVDSDDFIEEYAVEWILDEFGKLPKEDRYIGISGLKTTFSGDYMSKPSFSGYVDASNLERSSYGLTADMAESFITSKLRQYRFDVWPGETFLPEAVVWNRIAEDGFILRWCDKKIYRCEYLEGGLTRSFWHLLKRNPMGFAMLFKSNACYSGNLKNKIANYLHFGSCCFLASQAKCYFTAFNPVFAFLMSPAVYVLYRRRKKQLTQYVPEEN